MNKLSRKEASDVLAEARRLQEKYKDSGSRLSQSIHWACGYEAESQLPKELCLKLLAMLDKYDQTELDFYHDNKDNRVIQKFYEHYVEEY